MTIKINIIAACRRLYGAIETLDAEACARLGVDRNALRCLNFLEGGPQKAGAISAHLGLTTGATTTLISRLEDKGYVARKPDESDRRAVWVEMTAAVHAAVGPLYAGVAKTLTETVSRYPPEEQGAAIRHLTDAAAAYEAALSPPGVPSPPVRR
ncbi:MAG: MarR family transcriptional regulator [Pseudomonadota bacterium]